MKPDEDRSSVQTERRPRQGILDRIRATPGGRLALKIGVGVLGGLVVALGIVLIPFPGPGWAIVILGLAIWSLEFAWAKHLLEFTKKHVQAWTHWIGRQNWPVRILVAAVCFVFVCAIVWLSVKLSFGIDLIAEAKDWLAAR